MIPLPLPSAAEDDDYLARLCRDDPWQAHHGPWANAYTAYRLHGGNPWAVSPTTFMPDVSDAQKALYDTRKGTPRLRRIRETPGLLSCPMCGSPTTGSLDHYLPRNAYPEFSIMTSNLVPACSHCNSGVKGNTYRGTTPERFIHPYFDAFTNVPLWQVELILPYTAATFRAVPAPNLSAQHRTLVTFHLANVLGSQFLLWAQSKWATTPQLVRNAVGGAVGAITVLQVVEALTSRLRDDIATTGKNSWFSAFFRGLLATPQAHGFIANAAEPLAPTAVA
jgi:5-methylcytosine-specific restriction endonuclease McrA